MPIQGKDFFTVFLISSISSLVIGFSDVMMSILFTPRFYSTIYMFAPLAITVIFFFLFQVVLLLALIPLSYWLKLNLVRWFISISSFLVFFFIAGSAGDAFGFQLSAERVLKLMITFFISALFAIALFLLQGKEKNFENETHKGLLISMGFSLPFVFAGIMVFNWTVIYRGIDVFSGKFFLLIGLLILFIGFIIWIFHRLRHHKIKSGLVMGLGTMVVLCYFIQPGSPLDEEFHSKLDASPKYILLITVDTLRADAVSCYNPESNLTPNIDAFAQQSVLFKNAFTDSPWTLPAIASMMTGMPPSVHQATRYHARITGKLPTLAGEMKKAGYYTAAIGINPTLSKQTCISNGFIYYDFYPKFSTGRSVGDKIREHLSKYIPDEKITNVTAEDLVIDFSSFISTDRLTDLSIRWLGKNKDKSVFFWIHYFDPHVPYAPPSRWLQGREKKLIPHIGCNFDRPDDLLTGVFVPTQEEKEWIKELYNGEVRYVDHNLGRLFAALKQMGIYDRSLIILTSDHGEEFWDHGAYYHGHSLYNEVVSIPLIIKLSGKSAPKRIETTVSLQNLMPFILDYCKIKGRWQKIYNQSLLPLLTGEKGTNAFEPQPVVSSALRYGEEKEALYFDGLKYIRSEMSRQEELYNTAADPKEKNSIAAGFPEKIKQAIELLNRHFQFSKRIIKLFKINEVRKDKKKTSDPDQEDKLKSLGYF
jgi:arylsulfatase A-like enzyme